MRDEPLLRGPDGPAGGRARGGDGAHQRRDALVRAARERHQPKLKGSIGEGSNHLNFSDRSVKILSE